MSKRLLLMLASLSASVSHARVVYQVTFPDKEIKKYQSIDKVQAIPMPSSPWLCTVENNRVTDPDDTRLHRRQGTVMCRSGKVASAAIFDCPEAISLELADTVRLDSTEYLLVSALDTKKTWVIKVWCEH